MSTELIKVTINGKDFEVPKGARLIDVCRDKGFDIPSFCYYADLALQASCRMCLVRIEKMPKLQTSCTITCTDGMIVTTQSEEIEKAQRGMTEFLLANHPLDCPGLRSRRRMRTAGDDFRLGRPRRTIHRTEKLLRRDDISRRWSQTIRSVASSANVARASATSGWAKTRSKPVDVARTQ